MRERDLLDLLALRYSAVSQGQSVRYSYAEHVRSCAGFSARRTADFIATDLWPSSGLAIHGHEVKVSRADWLRELRDPSKSAEFIPFMDFWWLVTADPAIVKPGELPEGWGLMCVDTAGKLRVRTPAPWLRSRPMPRTMITALLHATQKTAHRRYLGHVCPDVADVAT